MFRRGKTNSDTNNYFAKGCITLLIPYVLCAIAFVFNYPNWDVRDENQNLAALSERGIQTQGCVVELIDPQVNIGYDFSDKLIYEFQTSQGTYRDELSVSAEYFQQSQIGDCYRIVYLPEDPAINRLEDEVNNYSSANYWADYFRSIAPLAIFFLVVSMLYLVGVYIFSLRFKGKKK